MARQLTKEEFDKVCDAIWSEIEYQNSLTRRTDNEAKEPAAFATLLRRYLRHLEDHWADQPALPNTKEGEPTLVVEDCLNDLRKLAAICVRGMAYSGIRYRHK